MSDPFLDAVRAVPHDSRCASIIMNFGRIGPKSETSPDATLACDCDRDERIARGLEEAVEQAARDGGGELALDAFALGAEAKP